MITVSQPYPFFKGAAAQAKPQPRFSGQKEYDQFLNTLREFPDDTIDRLHQITQIPGPAHITKAKELAREDKNVDWFNKQVTGFVSKRKSLPSAHEHLEDLRNAFKTVRQERGIGQNLDQQA